jgi:hypothetical protein
VTDANQPGSCPEARRVNHEVNVRTFNPGTVVKVSPCR